MAHLTLSSPHTRGANRTAHIMLWVIGATLPGLLALTYFFGWGTLINLVLASTVALSCEAAVLRLRQRPIGFFLRDYSALLTAVLIGIALPPFAPYWVTVVATAFAILFGKHLYGGLGNNPFNPAMLGYALVLVSFPVQMTTLWAQAVTASGQELLGFADTLRVIFGGQINLIDGLSGATALDTYKTLIQSGTAQTVLANPTFNGWLNGGWAWINLAFLLGGVLLLAKRIITWHIPVSMLVSLSLCSLFLGWDADMYVPLSLHLMSGATMLGAFFIATDPVSAATTRTGKLIYGAGIGILLYVIRTWGAYPDAVAFAVLLMNFAAPLIDAYTQPRSYGHDKAKRGMPKKSN